jgi:hypothetical protein
MSTATHKVMAAMPAHAYGLRWGVGQAKQTLRACNHAAQLAESCAQPKARREHQAPAHRCTVHCLSTRTTDVRTNGLAREQAAAAAEEDALKVLVPVLANRRHVQLLAQEVLARKEPNRERAERADAGVQRARGERVVDAAAQQRRLARTEDERACTGKSWRSRSNSPCS